MTGDRMARPLSAAILVRDAAARLTAAGSSTARLDAEVLLRHVLGLNRTAYFVRRHDPVSAEARAEFARLIERRAAGEPVAYLIERREFMGITLIVRPGVLVPRPETEGLVEWALERLPPSGVVLDVGTGSGAIALALAAHAPDEWPGQIVAADRSAPALAVAAENRDRLGLSRPVALVRGDLAEWCAGSVDLLLANLPYLRPEQLQANPDLRAEPVEALVAGDDGLDAIRRLIPDTSRLLTRDGALALEIDPSQAEMVAALLAAVLPGATIAVHRDLAGWSRFVTAERAAASEGVR